MKSRDGCEYGEHWTTIWTGGACANYLRKGTVPPSHLIPGREGRGVDVVRVADGKVVAVDALRF